MRPAPFRRRYCVRPGTVQSRHDRDVHLIGEGSLVSLYGLRPGQWIPHDGRHPQRCEGLPHLEPHEDGDYSLPE